MSSTSVHHQQFTIPDSVIYYVTKNPTKKAYEKMIKCCKYFFHQNPFIIIKDLIIVGDEWKSEPNCSKLQKSFLKNSCKIWILHTLKISSESEPKLANDVFKKLFRYSDIFILELERQNISFTELLLFTPTISWLKLNYVNVYGSDGAKISYDNIIPTLQKRRAHFRYIPSSPLLIVPGIEEKLVKMLQVSRIVLFILQNVPESFNIEKFNKCFKPSKNKQVRTIFVFAKTISDNCKIRLQALVNEIYEIKECDYVPPLILFKGQNYNLIRKVSSKISEIWKVFNRQKKYWVNLKPF